MATVVAGGQAFKVVESVAEVRRIMAVGPVVTLTPAGGQRVVENAHYGHPRQGVTVETGQIQAVYA